MHYISDVLILAERIWCFKVQISVTDFKALVHLIVSLKPSNERYSIGLFLLSVRFCNNQAKWTKIRSIHVKNHPTWQYEFLIKDSFPISKKTLIDLFITGFAQKRFRWYFRRSYLHLNCSFIMHFNEIITQFTTINMEKHGTSFSLILMVQIVRLNF